MPAEPCRKLAEAAQTAGYPVEIKVYPGAHHSFDSKVPMRFVAERINGNAPTGRGATTAGNAEAWADAIDQVTRFLAVHSATAADARQMVHVLNQLITNVSGMLMGGVMRRAVGSPSATAAHP